MSAHAFFAPSSAPRVVLCPGSLLLTCDMPDTQTEDAAHGTAAHWIADMALRENKHVEHYGGLKIAVDKHGECKFYGDHNQDQIVLDACFGLYHLFEVDDEMIVAVQEYCDWCNDAPGEKYPECRVDISKWCPKDSENIFVPAQAFEPQKGTSDHAACEPGRLIITDLKYGKGVKVFAQDNYQAVLYALGFIDEWDWLYDFEEIEIRICQPRLDHKDVWVVTREQIEELGRYILERFTLALKPDAPFNPGEKQCRFCKASGRCRAQADMLSKVRALAFEDLDFVPTALLTNEELVEAWRLHPFIQARFDAIEREMMKAMENGVKLPGVRLAEINCHRAWHNQAEAAAQLEAAGIPKEKLYTEPSLISPAQSEKLLPKAKREIVKTLAYKPRGGATIVDQDDKRPDYEAAVQAHVDASFDNLDDPFA
jgi:hypothetical protein